MVFAMGLKMAQILTMCKYGERRGTLIDNYRCQISGILTLLVPAPCGPSRWFQLQIVPTQCYTWLSLCILRFMDLPFQETPHLNRKRLPHLQVHQYTWFLFFSIPPQNKTNFSESILILHFQLSLADKKAPEHQRLVGNNRNIITGLPLYPAPCWWF